MKDSQPSNKIMMCTTKPRIILIDVDNSSNALSNDVDIRHFYKTTFKQIVSHLTYKEKPVYVDFFPLFQAFTIKNVWGTKGI